MIRPRSLHFAAGAGKNLRAVVAVLFLFALAGCVTRPTTPPRPSLELNSTSFAELKGWAEADPEKALQAFRRSCSTVEQRSAESGLGGAGYAGTAGDWVAPCRVATALPDGVPALARNFFESAFVPYRLKAGTADGLFTGYYEPLLRGSRIRQGPYQTPLYGVVPPEILRTDMLSGMMAMASMAMRFMGYPARAEIVRSGLPYPPLLYVDSPVEAFFLQIQGSGRVLLDDGTMIRAAYAGQNGFPYTPIGAVLIARGELRREEVSAQTIRAWLAAHPAEALELMDANASYVFFAELPIGDPDLGADGAQGVPLTPEASLAVDRSVHALGVPVWLETSVPAEDPAQPDRLFESLLVLQDTGGAIRGAVRGDVYWGTGEAAAAIAGRMKHQGRLSVLLPAAVAARLGTHAEFPLP